MNLLRISLLCAFFAFFVGSLANATELPPLNNYPSDTPEHIKTVSLEDMVPYKSKDIGTHNVTWNVFDSLGNSYSYFYLLTNKAFVYDKISGRYITIKRGFYQTGTEPAGEPPNSKNDVFVRWSDDLGKTWDEQVLVYNHKEWGFGEGRYPSVYGFEYDGTFSVGFCIPLVNEAVGEWYGHAWGFWNSDYDAVVSHDQSLTVDGSAFSWSTDNRVYCEGMGDDIVYQSVSEITPVAGTETISNANNIAYRKSANLTTPEKVVPPQWASNVFREVDEPGSGRFNQQVGFGPIAGDDMYMAVYGNFIVESVIKNKPAVSISNDKGDTWSDFNIIPNSVIDVYAEIEHNITIENPGDSIIFDWQTKSFVMLPNGDFSYIMKALIANYGERSTKIVEVYNEGGRWGIRTIADITGAYIVYADVTTTAGDRVNPSDIELQGAVSFDGTKIVAKWVDLIGYDPEMGNFETTDVFVATREVGKSDWSEKMNITNSDEIDRSTMLPDFVPNDLKDIPLLKMRTIDYSTNPEEVRTAQFNAGDPQHLVVGHFDTEVSVEDQNESKSFAIKRIYPNPADQEATILFTTDGYGSCTVDIYDVMGKKLQQNLVNNLSAGERFITLNTSTLPVGTYYVSLRLNGQSITEIMNVIR
jgi:hypothetical protein